MKLEDTLFEADEIYQIVVSMLAISFAFALVLAGIDGMLAFPVPFAIFTVIAIVTLGSGFVLHEMGHKLAAIYYGGQSRFRMWIQGVIFMLVMSALGVLFAAPGAVYIYLPNITKRQNGIISLAGPIVNVLITFFFLALSFVYPIKLFFPFIGGSGGVNVWELGAGMNLMLGLFNMIPAFPLDGSKVWDWSKPVWVGMTVAMLIMQAFIYPMGVISWVIMFVLFFILSKVIFRR